MTDYINGWCPEHATKKSLASAVKADPSKVRFQCTSEYGTVFNGAVSDMPKGATLSVVGPNPFTKRDWYASIAFTASGMLRVK